MNWFLLLWPMAAAASLTLALVHVGRWLGQREERAHLLFAVAATATAIVALIEMMLARAESTAQYATLVRWSHVSRSCRTGGGFRRLCLPGRASAG